jgi:hypothetical protein
VVKCTKIELHLHELLGQLSCLRCELLFQELQRVSPLPFWKLRKVLLQLLQIILAAFLFAASYCIGISHAGHNLPWICLSLAPVPNVYLVSLHLQFFSAFPKVCIWLYHAICWMRAIIGTRIYTTYVHTAVILRGPVCLPWSLDADSAGVCR